METRYGEPLKSQFLFFFFSFPFYFYSLLSRISPSLLLLRGNGDHGEPDRPREPDPEGVHRLGRSWRRGLPVGSSPLRRRRRRPELGEVVRAGEHRGEGLLASWIWYRDPEAVGVATSQDGEWVGVRGVPSCP
ncbi:unnamed protein product [Musa textilis]